LQKHKISFTKRLSTDAALLAGLASGGVLVGTGISAAEQAQKAYIASQTVDLSSITEPSPNTGQKGADITASPSQSAAENEMTEASILIALGGLLAWNANKAQVRQLKKKHFEGDLDLETLTAQECKRMYSAFKHDVLVNTLSMKLWANTIMIKQTRSKSFC